MGMTRDQIISEALALDPRDREAIAEELWFSVDSTTSDEVADAWATEIRRRVDEADRGEGASRPAHEVIERLQKKAQK